jgi:hypothetical protein
MTATLGPREEASDAAAALNSAIVPVERRPAINKNIHTDGPRARMVQDC